MTSLAFGAPWFALLLPLPFLLPWLWPERGAASAPEDQLGGQRVTLLHPHLGELQAAFEVRRPRRQLVGLLYRVLSYLLWVALVLALMQPQHLVPHTEISSPGYDLMLTIDASYSMEALDFTVEGREVNRMQVVKGVMGRFVDERAGDRLGLVVFGTRAYVLSPITMDRGAVRQLLETVVPSIAGPATALGDAIALGVKRLRERPPGSRVMILIADGDTNAGTFQPPEAARLARLAGVRIYVIGVGSKQPLIKIPAQNDMSRYEFWDDLDMNEDILKEVADLTGGAYFRATDTQALQEISRRIAELERTEAEARTAFLPEPLYRWPLGAAAVLLLALGLFPEGRRRFLRREASA